MAQVPKTKTTNKILFDIINDLRKLSNKTGESFGKAIAAKLAVSASQRAEVNLFKIEKLTKNQDTIIIPGKVLASGNLTKKITVIAYKFSKSAKQKIENVGGKTLNIEEFLISKSEIKPIIIV